MKLVLGLPLLIATLVLLPSRQMLQAMFGLLVLALIVDPRSIETIGATQVYVGISTYAPTIYYFSVVIVFSIVGLLLAKPSVLLKSIQPWLPFVSVSAFMCFYVWPHDSISVSGIFHYVSAVLCYMVGFSLVQINIVGQQELVTIFSAIIVIEFLFVIATLLGHPLHVAKGPQATDLEGRVIGTTEHPDQLAKLVIVCLIPVLGYAPSSLRLRRLRFTITIVGFALLALTQSRAGLIGLAVGLAIAHFLQPDRELRRRDSILLTGIFLIGLAATPTIASRFISDPSGGARDQLSQLAEGVISQHVWSGVGINHWVNVVGQIDPLTASGVPVHNMFLLAVGELGLVAGVLLWIPSILIGLSAWRSRRLHDARGQVGRAYITSIPALVLTGITGWGLLQTPILEIYCLILGTCGGYIGLALSPFSVQSRDSVEHFAY